MKFPKGCQERNAAIYYRAVELAATFINGNRKDLLSALEEIEEAKVAFAVLATLMDSMSNQERSAVARFLREMA